MTPSQSAGVVAWVVSASCPYTRAQLELVLAEADRLLPGASEAMAQAAANVRVR